MKTAASLLMLAGVLAVGCNTSADKHPASTTDSTTTTTTTTTVEKGETFSKEQPLKGCYLSVIKRDTFQLAITAEKGSAVEGSMILNFAEKDRSRGTFEGEFKNGILMGIYNFSSEGTTSQRQVAFKKVDNGFVEGYGKMKMVDGKEMFAKENEIEFDQANVFKYTENCLN